jgi:hypothetical protein
MQIRYLGTAMLCLALAALPATAATKKATKKPAEPEAIVTDVPPPSGSWEQQPAPNKDYVWSKGYYEWKDGRYAWKAGEWVLKKEDMVYEQHAWKQRPDGKWELTGGKFVSEGQAKKDDAKDGKDAKKDEPTKSMGAAKH